MIKHAYFIPGMSDDDGKESKGEDGDRDDDEYTRAVNKAKLLARITQLSKRGIRPSKTPTWRSTELELLVEVARMETLLEQQTHDRAVSNFLTLGLLVVAAANEYCDKHKDKDTV